MNKENLLKLADYLSQLPDGYERFNMITFAFINSYSGERLSILGFDKLKNKCDTICCAVGHGPLIGFNIIDSDDCWITYSVRVFGIENDAPEWDWCFSGTWSYRDNTPKGAAARIYYLIEKGLPDNYLDQIEGQAPLCYLDYRK